MAEYKYQPEKYKDMAEFIVEKTGMTEKSRVLDVGCGDCCVEPFFPKCDMHGFDIHKHSVPDHMTFTLGDASKQLPYGDKEFDIAFSLGMVQLIPTLDGYFSAQELDRVGKKAMVLDIPQQSSIEWYNHLRDGIGRSHHYGYDPKYFLGGRWTIAMQHIPLFFNHELKFNAWR